MLRERAAEAFGRALQILSTGQNRDLSTAPAAVEQARARLSEPMRVALVGRVSSGKSTLANALLGGELVATGVAELTYNVNWLRYADEPRLVVHFTDGRAPQQRSLADLEAVTVRREENREFLSAIDYIVVDHPNPRLRAFDLIDTPGLDSHYGTDSANTLRFLGRRGDDVRAASVDQAGRADALVLVLARGMARGDEALLADFRGSAAFGGAGPVTTIGALTKVELYWPDHSDPLRAGRRIAERLMAEAGAGRLLYELCPVASLVGAAAATLTDADTADLLDLAALPPELLSARLARGHHFTSRDYPDLPLPAPRRAAIFGRLGGYGINLACRLLREGVPDPASLRENLAEHSGLNAFRTLLVDHFGNRADLVKLQHAADRCRQTLRQLMDTAPPGAYDLLLKALGPIEQLVLDEHALAELAVLRDHYAGRLTLDASTTRELLCLTGERGADPFARLGLAPGVPLEVARDHCLERLGHWRTAAGSPAWSGAERRAAEVLSRSYERFAHHLNQALDALDRLH
ncbi:dynamin family protein [Streptomyces sp. NBC_00658]|uniref:dynamin family protein n=1 Tax=Streptomyces sp. NBC_00658 TaxID=2975800 RepID=UPI00324353D0